MSNTPTAFISYSHDTQSHIDWVMGLASSLVESGVDVILDKWSLKAGDDLPAFMEKSLRGADYVLMVCTEKYVTKANGGDGGVGYEKMIVTAGYLSNIDNNKVIPIIRQNGTNHTPTFLNSKLYIDLSSKADYEYGFDELCRRMHDAPAYKKPAIGTNPYKNMDTKPPPPSKPQSTPADTVLRSISFFYNEGFECASSEHIAKETSLSRLMTERLLRGLYERGLINYNGEAEVYLTADGVNYVLDNGLD